jgi:hypothetical protein
MALRRSLLVILTVQILFTACSERNENKPEKRNLIKKGDEFHFVLSGESVSVPAVYLKGGSEDHLGVLHYVKLWALLPDFEAYEKSKNHYDFHPKKGFGRVVNVKLISRAQRQATLNEIIRSNAEILKYTPLSGRLGQFDELKYDLEVYRSNTYGNDEYLYRKDNNTISFIRCSSKKQNVPYPSCNMIWDLTQGISIEAVFSMDYLSEWKAMVNYVNRLVKRADKNGMIGEADNGIKN